MKERYVVDTSIIIDGKVPKLIKKEKAEGVVVPYVVLDELQAQASKGREEGFLGLDELKKIRTVCEEKGIKLKPGDVTEHEYYFEIRLLFYSN